MVESYEFLRALLDTVPEHIVVIDGRGGIQYSNRSWNHFGQVNQCRVLSGQWTSINYLNVCDQAAEAGDEFGIEASQGIQSVIDDQEPEFYLEYPCHSPDTKRWFLMQVVPLLSFSGQFYVISHKNITERRLAEEKVYRLSQYDGLTDIPNRRCFDEYLADEWRRCGRLNIPLSVAMLDLDHFKLLNDTYGHPKGDDCLKAVGKTLKDCFKRSTDLCARYGGEEFAVVMSGMAKEQACEQLTRLLEAIRALEIMNEQSPTCDRLTASIGVADVWPDSSNSPEDFVEQVDAALYEAKRRGRNQLYNDSLGSIQ